MYLISIPNLPLTRGSICHCPLTLRFMEQQMILISKPEVERLLDKLQRAEGYCRNARSSSPFNPETDINAEPWEFFVGSSGFAGAVMRDAIQSLESHLN